MKANYLVGLLILISAVVGQAQEEPVALVDPSAKLLKEGYHYRVEKNKAGQVVYKQFYPSTRQITHLKTYRKRKRKVLDGPYMEWWDDGSPRMIGQFEDNERVGEWTFYSTNTRHAYERGLFVNSEKAGLWQSVDSLGRIRSEKTYLDGALNGPFTAFSETGDTTKYGTYAAGEVLEEIILIPDTMDQVSDAMKQREQVPYMAACKEFKDKEERENCSQKTMLMHVYSNIRYPAIAREEGIEGQAMIQFVVNKEGDVQDVLVKRGLCDEIKAECLKVVQSLPKWEPGIQKGEPVKVLFTLPIKFKLE